MAAPSDSALNTELSVFHDGYLDGFLISESSVLFFLSTMEKQAYVLIAKGVERMKADGFRQGNIIFDVLARRADQLSIGDVRSLYDTLDGEVGERQTRTIWERLTQEGRVMLEINPSYGCECLLIAQTLTVHLRAEASVFLSDWRPN